MYQTTSPASLTRNPGKELESKFDYELLLPLSTLLNKGFL